MAKPQDTCDVQCKRKAVTALLPFAVWQERSGDHRMKDALLAVVTLFGSTTSLWHPIVPIISTLFNAASPEVVITTSPHVPWDRVPNGVSVVGVWARATSAVEYTDETGRRVVDALLQIASIGFLRPHVPRSSWLWLNKRPSLPPICLGRSMGTKKHVVRRVRKLRDIGTLKSYLLLVWSEWDPIGSPQCLSAMQSVISRELRGAGMRGHRKDLANRLDYVVGQLDRGLGHLQRYNLRIDENIVRGAKAGYKELRELLRRMDE